MKNRILSLCTIAAISFSTAASARQQTHSHSAFQAGVIGKNSFSTEKAAPIESGKMLAQNQSKPSSTGSSTTNSSSKPATTKSSSSSKNKNKKPKYVSPYPGQYPEASERLLTDKDMEHMTPWGMKVMQNEIYARQGYIFKDPELRKHFAGEKWYKGKQSNINKIKLTPTEKQNINFIKSQQAKAKI